MPKIREIINLEKKNMPAYQFHFLYHRVMPGFFYVIGGAIVVAILGVILSITTESEIIPLIPVIAWGISIFPLLILFVIGSRKVSIRLLIDKTNEFENKYKIVDYEVAKQQLIHESIIKDDRLIFEGKDIALKDCIIVFNCKTLSGIYSFTFVFIDKTKPNDEAVLIYNMEKNINSFFKENINLILNKEVYRLFLEDKKSFLKLLFKYNDPFKMEKFLLKNQNPSQ